jgi:hypothetical protein
MTNMGVSAGNWLWQLDKETEGLEIETPALADADN